MSVISFMKLKKTHTGKKVDPSQVQERTTNMNELTYEPKKENTPCESIPKRKKMTEEERKISKQAATKKYQENNKEKILERTRKWRENNKERFQQHQSKYYMSNQEKKNQESREYYHANTDYFKQYYEKRNKENKMQQTK